MDFKEIKNPTNFSENGVLKPHHVTIDHIIPQCKGGKWTYDNCVAACAACNTEKSDQDAFAFYMLKQEKISQRNGGK